MDERYTKVHRTNMVLPLADPGGNTAMAPFGLSAGLDPQPAKNFARADGY